jgi:hypothetical protein
LTVVLVGLCVVPLVVVLAAVIVSLAGLGAEVAEVLEAVLCVVLGAEVLGAVLCVVVLGAEVLGAVLCVLVLGAEVLGAVLCVVVLGAEVLGAVLCVVVLGAVLVVVAGLGGSAFVEVDAVEVLALVGLSAASAASGMVRTKPAASNAASALETRRTCQCAVTATLGRSPDDTPRPRERSPLSLLHLVHITYRTS